MRWVCIPALWRSLCASAAQAAVQDQDTTIGKAAVRTLTSQVGMFFSGSLRPAVAAHLAQRDTDISDEELKRLAKMIRHARTKGK